MVRKELSPHKGYVRVIFELPASIAAERAHLVGDFNHWDPFASPFKRMCDGVWRITLDLPAWRRYEFRYLIDGQWCTDYYADGCIECSGYAINSVVETTLPLENLAACTGHSMVREAAYGRGRDFGKLREVRSHRS